MEVQSKVENLHPAVYGMFGALLGSIIGAGGTILVTFINKSAEARKQTRELAVRWGIEAWRNDFEASKLMKNHVVILPLDDYILHALLMSETLFKSTKLSEQDFIDAVQRNMAFVQRVGATRTPHRHQQNKGETMDDVPPMT